MDKKNKKPKVSIIIPVYNGENYLEEAINSALSQTYPNIEIIVVNDGSTDSTDKICTSYKNKIKYFKKTNGGVSSALNLGIKKMTGEYFSWLSHDDIYMPTKISEQMEFINYNKKFNDIVYNDYSFIDSNGTDIRKPRILNKAELRKKPEYALLRGSINGITLLIPKNIFDVCGNFDEKLKCVQDYDMWLRIYEKGYKFIHMDKLLTKSRIHSLQVTENNPLVLEEGATIWKKLIELPNDERKIILEGSVYNYYYHMAVYLLTTPHRTSFDYCVNECKKLDPVKYKKNPIKTPTYFKKIIGSFKKYGFSNAYKLWKKRTFNRTKNK